MTVALALAKATTFAGAQDLPLSRRMPEAPDPPMAGAESKRAARHPGRPLRDRRWRSGHSAFIASMEIATATSSAMKGAKAPRL